MTPTAIGRLWFPHQSAPTHQVAAEAAVDRDATPLAQRIALAEADLRDLDGRIASSTLW